MNYIVMDLEWNQSSSPEKTVPGLPFEIVEIGAVKYNENLEQTGSFSELICPKVYTQMHQITGELIRLDMEQLKHGDCFVKVMERFLNGVGKQTERRQMDTLRTGSKYKRQMKFVFACGVPRICSTMPCG